MNILVVAPDIGLKNVEDWVSAAAGNQLTVLNGPVSVREALGHIASGKYQIIHFATHGNTGSLQLSNGEIPGELLEDAIRSAGNIELVILGACASVAMGAALYRAGVPRVLSWRADVGDETAVRWAQSFYASLHISGDLWDATHTAAETIMRLGAEPPIYLNGRLSVMQAEIRRIERRGRSWRWLTRVMVLYGIVLMVLIALIAHLLLGGV